MNTSTRLMRYNAGRSFLNIIGQMRELCEEAKENPEKKLKPFFTSGSGQKRTQGKSLWNLEGMKYFH
jgi:hypothetical protein